MNENAYAILKYFPSITSDESYDIAALYRDDITGRWELDVFCDWEGLAEFDDMLDIDFAIAYVDGIKEELAATEFNDGEREYPVECYTRFFVNDFRFVRCED